jgi:hypothetical protein
LGGDGRAEPTDLFFFCGDPSVGGVPAKFVGGLLFAVIPLEGGGRASTANGVFIVVVCYLAVCVSRPWVGAFCGDPSGCGVPSVFLVIAWFPCFYV